VVKAADLGKHMGEEHRRGSRATLTDFGFYRATLPEQIGEEVTILLQGWMPSADSLDAPPNDQLLE